MTAHAHRLFTLLFLTLMIFSLNSCKEKGCTDPNSINYNSVADEDDGSCITCTSTLDTLDELSQIIMDNNFSSPHYNQNVARITLIQFKNNFTYSQCGSNDCYFKVKIESFVSEKMIFTFSVQVNGNVFISWQSSVVVQPNQDFYTVKIPPNNVSNPCGDLTGSSFFVGVSGTITYQ